MNFKYNKKIKLDIIIPTYNRPSLLKKCIDSALEFNHDSIRIIVIDDGSELTEKIEYYSPPKKRTIKNFFIPAKSKHIKINTIQLIEKFFLNKVEYIRLPKNVGLGKVFEEYKKLKNKAEYMTVINDDDVYISTKPIFDAFKILDFNRLISFVCISLTRQSDDKNINHTLDLNYSEMSGEDFIKLYVKTEDLQHTTMYGIFRTEYIEKTNALCSKNLRKYGLEDAFGIDSDFLFRMAGEGSVDFINKPHVLRRETAGLTEMYPVSFAYCYYQYIKDAMEYLTNKNKVDDETKKIFLKYWLKIMLMMYSSSLFDKSSKEKGDENIKKHLKEPFHLFIIKELTILDLWFDEEMKNLYTLTLKKTLNPSLNP